MFAACRSPIRVVLCGLGDLCVEFAASTYGRRRLWITFWREFWGVFWCGFWGPIGPGASVRGVFSAEGVLLVRWASANFDFFRGFFTFLARFLPVFVPNFALFPSMSCAYLYVNNYFSVSLAWELHSLHRRGRRARRERRRLGKGGGETAQPSPQRSQRPALSERSESKGRRGGRGERPS